MKISNIDVSNLRDFKDLIPTLSRLLSDIKLILNGGIIFQDNFSSKIAQVTFSAANLEVRVEHNLGRVPNGYVVLSRSASSIIYDGQSENSTQYLFLRASAITNATVMVI